MTEHDMLERVTRQVVGLQSQRDGLVIERDILRQQVQELQAEVDELRAMLIKEAFDGVQAFHANVAEKRADG